MGSQLWDWEWSEDLGMMVVLRVKIPIAWNRTIRTFTPTQMIRNQM